MGLLDQFAGLGNLSESQNNGLLAAASQMLQQSGRSPTRSGFGQILGGGLQAFQGTMAEQKKRQQEEEQMRQMMDMRKLQMQEMQGGLQDRQAQRDDQGRLRAFESTLNAPGGMPPPQAQPQPAAPEQQSEAISIPLPFSPGMSAPQAMQPPAPTQGPQQGSRPGLDTYEGRLARANAYWAAGWKQQGNAEFEMAQKMKPEFSQSPQNGRDQVTGKPIQYVLDKNGNPKIISGVAPPKDIKLLDNGQSFEAYDQNDLEPGKKFQRYATPDARLAAMRAGEANGIAAKAAGVTTSTGLRKEFDNLDEVKNFKMAVPAYKAIVDAAKRNTPMADINLVYGIAKLYDPTSVVREGEYNTVANSPNIPERVKGWIQYVSGGGKLTPAVKAQIVQEAGGRFQAYESSYTAARDNYSDIAKRSGGDSSLVFPTAYKSPMDTKPAPVSAPPQAVAMLKANPAMRAAFDQKYGPGSAASILGK